MVPLGRIAEPKEIYMAIKFIFECDFFTGDALMLMVACRFSPRH